MTENKTTCYTVGELREALEPFDDDTRVVVNADGVELNTAVVREESEPERVVIY